MACENDDADKDDLAYVHFDPVCWVEWVTMLMKAAAPAIADRVRRMRGESIDDTGFAIRVINFDALGGNPIATSDEAAAANSHFN